MKNKVADSEVLSSELVVERYKFTVSYNGKCYQGFQGQLGSRTVQNAIECAMRKLGWNEKAIIAAGRTDSGVHAEGQVFSAALVWRHGTEKLLTALNANLPDDISILAVRKVPDAFHARYDASARRYHYHIYFDSVRNPLRDPFCWRIWPALDLDILNTASAKLTGMHDFRVFGTPPRTHGTTIRTVTESYWFFKEKDEAVFQITANAFLYHMVRRIVYLLTALAQNRINATDWQSAIDAVSEPISGLAPPNGLRLYAVDYNDQCMKF